MIKAGRYDEAIPLLKNVVAKNPNDADAWNYLGFASRHLGKNAEALDFYNKALALDPKHKGAHEYLGELYLQTKQPAKAQEQLAILQGMCNDRLRGGLRTCNRPSQITKPPNPGSS